MTDIRTTVLGLLQAGDHASAARAGRQGLSATPADVELLHLLGIAEWSSGDHRGAIRHVLSALASNPTAVAIGDNAFAMLRAMGDPAGVLRLSRSLAAATSLPRWRLVHADALFESGRLDDAVGAYLTVVGEAPDNADAWNNLGVARSHQGRSADAISSWRRALAVLPAHVDTLINLNDRAYAERDFVAADRWASRAVATRDDASGWSNLGNARQRHGRYVEAVAAYRRSTALAPGTIAGLNGLGTGTMEAGRQDEAGLWIRAALAVAPADPAASLNRSTWLLLQGRMDDGLAAYEWRWHAAGSVARRTTKPEWNGEDLSGLTLHVYPEQGLGDVVFAARYLPILASRGAQVRFECPSPARRLLRCMTPAISLVGRESEADADRIVPLLSLPRLLGPEIGMAAADPYLRSDPALIEAWGPRIPDDGLRIGIAWQGNPDQPSEPLRSPPLAILHRAMTVPGRRFVVLQKEFGREQLARLPGGVDLTDLGPELGDLADTAAVISSLDLVVTSCTVIAHLAGALGKPTWVMLKHVGDWRWLLNRVDSPWYPSVRLFRQPRPGDWTSVGDRIASALSALPPA